MLEGHRRIASRPVCGCTSQVTTANAQGVHCSHLRGAEEVPYAAKSTHTSKHGTLSAM
jgi:hypothetical protein